MRDRLIALAVVWLAAPGAAGAEHPTPSVARVGQPQTGAARARVHKDRGDLLAKAGRAAQAITSYRAAIALDPEYVAAYEALGELLVDLKRSAEAVRHYRIALRDNPGEARLWRLLAFTLRKTGQHREALSAYRRYAQLKPEDASSYYGIALAYRAMGKTAAAVGAFNTFLLRERRPDQRAWLVKARETVLALGGRPVRSPLISTPRDGEPASVGDEEASAPAADFDAQLAARLERMESTRAAADLLRHVPIPQPPPPLPAQGADALRAQGDSLARLGNCSDALVRYAQALVGDAFNLLAYDGIAYCSAQLGRLKAGVARLRVALRDNPRYTRGWLHLARLQRLAGDAAAAVVGYRKYLLLKPRAQAVWLELAAAQRSLKRPGQAVATYRRYLALAGQDEPLSPASRRAVESAIDGLEAAQ